MREVRFVRVMVRADAPNPVAVVSKVNRGGKEVEERETQ